MDGPNVNLKILRDLQTEIRSNPEDPYIMSICARSLHNVHSAFKNSFQKSDMNEPLFLKSFYYVFVFNNSPTCNDILIQVSNLDKTPLKFCQVRHFLFSAIRINSVRFRLYYIYFNCIICNVIV